VSVPVPPPAGVEAPPAGVEAPPAGVDAPPAGVEAPPAGVVAPPPAGPNKSSSPLPAGVDGVDGVFGVVSPLPAGVCGGVADFVGPKTSSVPLVPRVVAFNIF